jgi:hypothetical protein
MIRSVRLRSQAQTVIAWQFTGQPFHQWPAWVQDYCTLARNSPDGRLALRHARRSGVQLVYLDEWLVKDLDGGICFYTPSELQREFEAIV